MRTWFLSAVLAAVALGFIGLTPSESQAYWNRPRLYYPYYPGYVYYPPIQSYYTSPGYAYNYSYYSTPYYTPPAYGYSSTYYVPPYNPYAYSTGYPYRSYYYAPTYYYP